MTLIAEAPKSNRVGKPSTSAKGVYARGTTPWSDRASLPKPIPGAEWCAGVSEGNEQFRVTLNGEPVTLAIAANQTAGWVITRRPACFLMDGVHGHELAAGTVTLRGAVKIVRINHCES